MKQKSNIALKQKIVQGEGQYLDETINNNQD